MTEELIALEQNGIWTVSSLPEGKHVIGCNTYKKKDTRKMIVLSNLISSDKVPPSS